MFTNTIFTRSLVSYFLNKTFKVLNKYEHHMKFIGCYKSILLDWASGESFRGREWGMKSDSVCSFIREIWAWAPVSRAVCRYSQTTRIQIFIERPPPLRHLSIVQVVDPCLFVWVRLRWVCLYLLFVFWVFWCRVYLKGYFRI